MRTIGARFSRSLARKTQAAGDRTRHPRRRKEIFSWLTKLDQTKLRSRSRLTGSSTKVNNIVQHRIMRLGRSLILAESCTPPKSRKTTKSVRRTALSPWANSSRLQRRPEAVKETNRDSSRSRAGSEPESPKKEKRRPASPKVLRRPPEDWLEMPWIGPGVSEMPAAGREALNPGGAAGSDQGPEKYPHSGKSKPNATDR